MKLVELVQTSHAVAATRSRLEKVKHLSALLRAASGEDISLVTHYLSGHLPQGRIGVGPALVSKTRDTRAGANPCLTLVEVDSRLTELGNISGTGSAKRRSEALSILFSLATAPEQAFIAHLLVGDVRQGAQEGVMLDAVADAAEIPAALARRAWMLSGSLPSVLQAALTGGEEALAAYCLEPGRAVRPMLAQPAESIDRALETPGTCIDIKMDGVRIQAHRNGKQIWLFTRQLHEVSRRLPEVVAQLLALDEPQFILDGELIALRDDGSPEPFQVTMRRFGRESNIEALAESLPLTPLFFDMLHMGGQDFIDHTAGERFAAMGNVLPSTMLMPRKNGASLEDARNFMNAALSQGHEGVMVKRLDSVYQAGSRGADWLKVKPVHTLDLVILAAEWGSGRRRGWLSNLHLGARGTVDADDHQQRWVMLGKTFKGLTDDMLKWQTKALLERETHREAHVVYVEPSLVVEIAFNEVTVSPTYPGGMALRFARVKRFRPDKSPEQVDSAESVAALLPS